MVTAAITAWLAFASAALPFPPPDSAPPLPALTRSDLEAWLDGFAPLALEQGDIAGAVVVVVKDGAVLLQKGYGLADVARGTRMDPTRTVLGVGSVSKLFTWTAVMQQVEQGKLDLDRDIDDYLDFHVPEPFGPITLRNLMTHTAGFAARGYRQYPHPRLLGPHLRGTPPPPVIFPPGLITAYSNYGAMLAGYLVERASGEPFVDYLDRHVLGPLGMNRSSFRRPVPDQLQADLAPSYDLASGAPEPPNHEEPAGDPSGHLVTTAADLSHFMLAQLDQGRYDGRAILRPETVALMQAPAFTSVPGGQATALGFFRLDDNGHRILWHGGDIAGFHAALHLLPDDHVGFFVGVNSNGLPKGVLNAANEIRTVLFHRFMDRYFPAPPAPTEPTEPTLPTARAHGRLIAGEYDLSARPSGDYQEALFLLQRYALGLRIELLGDGTISTPGFLSFEDGRPKRWHEVAPFVWRQVNGTARLRADVRDGRVRGVWPDDLPSVYLMQPVSPVASAGLNVPLFLGAVVVVAAAGLAWPIGWVARRTLGVTGPWTGTDRPARTAFRAATALAVAFLLGWMMVVASDLPSRAGTDGWVRLVQVVGVAFVVATVAAMLTLRQTWRTPVPRWVRIGRTVTALALLELVWFSFAFHLLSVHLNY